MSDKPDFPFDFSPTLTPLPGQGASDPTIKRLAGEREDPDIESVKKVLVRGNGIDPNLDVGEDD